MNRSSSKIIVVLILILSSNASVAVVDCVSQSSANIPVVDQQNGQNNKEQLTAVSSHVKATKKSKSKSIHLGLFKFLLPDMN